ncbi:MAG TPA: hypothetical protein VIM48_07610, partial [Chthoniobacterales bacterium]
TMVEAEGGLRVAVRPSGTEPKIKFYLFAAEAPEPGDIPSSKTRARSRLDAAWQWLKADAETRLAV